MADFVATVFERSGLQPATAASLAHTVMATPAAESVATIVDLYSF